MKLCNIHIKNLIILSVSGNFRGFKNWQKAAEICYQLVHDRVSRGLALFRNWRHRLIYMALTLCEHACKTTCDVKSRIDPSPSPARSWDKEYQISGCTVAQRKFQMLRKNVKSLLEQFQVCIFAEMVFGVRCTLSNVFYEALISFQLLVYFFNSVISILDWVLSEFHSKSHAFYMHYKLSTNITSLHKFRVITDMKMSAKKSVWAAVLVLSKCLCFHY